MKYPFDNDMGDGRNRYHADNIIHTSYPLS